MRVIKKNYPCEWNVPLTPHLFVLTDNNSFTYKSNSILYFQVKESQSRIEELETTNNHLQRRLDKVKNAKSALLKEL